MSKHIRPKPNSRTVRRVVEHLEEIGLAVYGPCMDLSEGVDLGGYMDYHADEVIKYRKLKAKHSLLLPDAPFPLESPWREDAPDPDFTDSTWTGLGD